MGTVSRTERFWWFLILAMLVWLCWWSASRGQDDPAVQYNADRTWLYLSHESGTTYVIRGTAIAGFVSPVPGDTRQRSGILMSGGKTLYTTLDIEEFKDLVLAQDDSLLIEKETE